MATWNSLQSVMLPTRLDLLGSNLLCSCAAEGRRGAERSAALAVWHEFSGGMGCTESGAGSRA